MRLLFFFILFAITISGCKQHPEPESLIRRKKTEAIHYYIRSKNGTVNYESILYKNYVGYERSIEYSYKLLPLVIKGNEELYDEAWKIASKIHTTVDQGEYYDYHRFQGTFIITMDNIPKKYIISNNNKKKWAHLDFHRLLQINSHFHNW